MKGEGGPLDLARVSKIFNRTRLKTLTLKQMLQRLPMAPARVKAGNTSENLLHENGKVIYSLYRANKLLKKKKR